MPRQNEEMLGPPMEGGGAGLAPQAPPQGANVPRGTSAQGQGGGAGQQTKYSFASATLNSIEYRLRKIGKRIESGEASEEDRGQFSKLSETWGEARDLHDQLFEQLYDKKGA